MDLDAAAGNTEEGLITDDVDDEFQDLTDGEIVETNKVTESVESLEDKQEADDIAQSEVVGEMTKTKGVKKKLFKQVIGGNSKMRLVQTLASPRKRNQAKGTSKLGEGTKQVEGQRTSNPKPGNFKP